MALLIEKRPTVHGWRVPELAGIARNMGATAADRLIKPRVGKAVAFGSRAVESSRLGQAKDSFSRAWPLCGPSLESDRSDPF